MPDSANSVIIHVTGPRRHSRKCHIEKQNTCLSWRPSRLALCAGAGQSGRIPPRSAVSGSSPSDTVTRERSCIHCLLNTVSNNA